MEYKDAIRKLISLYGEEILKDHFLSFSILSDYIGSSIYSKKLLFIFAEVNKKHDLYSLFKNHKLLEARNILTSDFKKGNYNCDSKEFVDALNPISELLNPIEFKDYESKKLKQSKPTKKKKVIKKKEVTKVEDDNNIVELIYTLNDVASKKAELKNIDVNVNECKGLSICMDNKSDNEYCLCKVDEQTKNLVTIKEGEADENLTLVLDDDAEATYYLFVPKCKYESLNVNVGNGSLNIYGSNKKKSFICDEVKINVNNGNLFFNGKTNRCDINGNNGDIELSGTYGDLNINRIDSNISGWILFKSKKESYYFKCVLINGKINLYIEKLYKSIGRRMFFKRRNYCGFENIGDKKLLINIATANGEININ